MSCIDSKGWSWATRIISILLLILVAALTFALGNNWRLGFLVLVSTPLGALCAWKRFSFSYAFRAVLLCIDFTEIMHIFVVILVSALIVAPITSQAKGGHPLFDSGGKFVAVGGPVGLSDALGGLLFGIGMELSSACVFGTIIGMGQGVVKSWIVALGVVIGAAAGACDPVWPKLSGWPSAGASVDWWAILLILVGIIAALIIAYFVKDRVVKRGTPGLESLSLGLNYSETGLSPQRNLQDWKRYLVDVGIGGLLGLFFGCTGVTQPVIGALGGLGGRFVRVCGGNVGGWRKWKYDGSMIEDTGFLSVIFILLGSLVFTSWTATVGEVQLNSWKELLAGCIGGVIMGFGGAISCGCTIEGVVAGLDGASAAPIVWILCALLGVGIIVLTEHYGKWRGSIKTSPLLHSILKSFT
jgi:hypothetical protein